MRKNLIGKTFGRLVVLEDSGLKDKQGTVTWPCICDCGNIAMVLAGNLKNGFTKSCGCLNKELIAKRSYKHGDNCRGKTERLYRIWINMKKRCYGLTHKNSHNYKKKAIKVCPEWINSYVRFKKWALVSGYKSNLTIDRIDNDGNYQPSNCQWLTRSENTKKYFKEDYHGSARI